MRAENFTDYHRKNLTEEMTAARAALVAKTRRTRELADTMPPAGDPSPSIVLWNKAGRYAGFACVWFVFIAPILLVLEFWD